MPVDIKFLSKSKSAHKRFWITDKEKTKSFLEKLDFIPEEVCFESEIAIPTRAIFEFAEAFSQGAELLYEQKKYSEAIEKFKHALQIKPDDLVVKRELAKAYLENDDYSNFEREANYLVNRKYEDYEYDQRRWIYLFYGNYYDLKGMREKAIEMYNKVLEIKKGDEHPQNMSKIYLKKPYKKELKKDSIVQNCNQIHNAFPLVENTAEGISVLIS
jgi:tetratricopeptide (TPR) repeat protein